jgi:hypothetical protein
MLEVMNREYFIKILTKKYVSKYFKKILCKDDYESIENFQSLLIMYLHVFK